MAENFPQVVVSNIQDLGKKRKILVGSGAGVAVLVLVIVSALVLNTLGERAKEREARVVPTPTPQPTLTIFATDSGFVPERYKIPKQTTVTFLNMTDFNVEVASDAHPTHTLFPELNLGTVPPGQIKVLKLDKAGTYTYHNNLNPTQKGTIEVE